MKVRIEIEGDTSDTALTAVMMLLAGNDAAPHLPAVHVQMEGRGERTTSIAPSSPASPPLPSVPTATVDDDDDSGPASDAAVDSTGLPWDERIHAATRTQTQAGVWKRKKGVSVEAAAPIEAELRQASLPPAPVAAAPAPAMPPMPAPVAAAPAPAMPPMPAPAAPVPPMPAATAPSDQPALTFTDFMARLGTIMAARPEVNVDCLTDIAKRFGMNVISDLHVKPELMSGVIATLQAEGKWA